MTTGEAATKQKTETREKRKDDFMFKEEMM